jgi:TolA-binding protein
MRRHTWTTRAGVGLMVAAACALALAGRPARAGEDDAKPSAPSLTAVGMKLDAARLAPVTDRAAGVADAARMLEAALKADIPSRRKVAALYLSAEVRYAAADYRGAAELFEQARKKDKRGPFADDADFLRIVALEAVGRDEEAVEKWKKWTDEYAESPLLPEALLARGWNEIRRDSLRLASNTFSELERRFEHYADDDRFRLATATVAYLRGHAQEALTRLGDSPKGAAPLYLRALCLEAEGKMLKAAADYQRVFESYPHSPLRDHSMLAKANIFLASRAYQSAAEEYGRVVETVTNAEVRGEAQLREAACFFLAGDSSGSADRLREVARAYKGQDVAARAQLLLAEVEVARGHHENAILEFNRVLTDYFEHDLAAAAQYRVGRALDVLGRRVEATSAYMLVVAGYPLSPQAPAAAYLAGAGLLEQDRPREAVPYFQLVLDRYAQDTGDNRLDFASPEHQELVEAALCLLELSYHRTGDMGRLSGVPHLMLQKMPESQSQWRALALLIDADALAAQGRYDEARAVLEKLLEQFPGPDVAIPGNRLLAWTYAQQGHDEMAIEVEERMLVRYGASGSEEDLSAAYLHKAHILFNTKDYKTAAAAYDEFCRRFPDHPEMLLALYQSGLCYYRLSQNGDAVDRWELLVETDPSAPIAERAWVRAGDLYFQADHFEEAKRCYRGLLDNFASSRGAALGMLRLAQCDFNAGDDRAALEMYSEVAARFPGTGIAREAERGMETALYRLGQQENGSEVLAELVEKYPTSSFAADAQFEIAMRHYDAKEFAEAAESFRRVVSQFPDYSAADRAHFLMAESYGQAGQAAEAANAYEQFLVFFPDSEFEPTVRFELGGIRFADGRYMQAAVDFSAVLETEAPAEIRNASLFNLALCRKMLGAVLEAREALLAYREQHPQDERAVHVAYHLADLHEQSGELEEAAREYERALGAKPSLELKVELHYRLGNCREELGETDAAIAAYEKARASKIKDDVFRLTALARCAALYETREHYKKAIAAYRDLMKHANDPELALAAEQRVTQLEAMLK